MPRVGNRKVRTGCLRCKARHVKCDEGRPRCGWCEDHSLECEYPIQSYAPVIHPSTPSVIQSPSSVQSGSTSITSSSLTASARSQLELGLLHYYIVNVAPQHPYLDRERGWQLQADIVPQEALRCPCLLNAIYAKALLHMHISISKDRVLPRNASFFEEQGLRMNAHIEDDRTKVDLLSLHREYLDLAVQQQRSLVSNMNNKNADGVCLTAILLAMIALVHSAQVDIVQEYAIPTNWFNLQASFSFCLQTARPILTMDSAINILINTRPTVDDWGLDHTRYNIFLYLVDWQPETMSDDIDQHRETYETTLAYIQTIYKRIAEEESWECLGRRILAFPNIVPANFILLLQQNHPRALVMFAHLIAITKRLDLLWWVFRGVADFHVRGIASLVPDEWQWALAWPFKVLDTAGSDDCFVL